MKNIFEDAIVFDNVNINQVLASLSKKPLTWFPRVKILKPFLRDDELIVIAEKLKTIEPLRWLKILNTQLNKNHLKVLASVLLWNLPQKLTVELNFNNIADKNFKYFVYPLCEENVNLSKLFIINNPSIYKGNFLQELKEFLIKKNSKNQKTYLKLIKNKEKKSMALLRINNQWSQEEKERKVQLAYEKINHTIFYSLNLSNISLNQFIPLQTFIHDQAKPIFDFISEIDISNNNFESQDQLDNLIVSLSKKQQILKANISNKKSVYSFSKYQLIENKKAFNLNLLSVIGINFSKETIKLLLNSFLRYSTQLILKEIFFKQDSVIQNLRIFIDLARVINKEKQKQSLKAKQIQRNRCRILDLSNIFQFEQRVDILRGIQDQLVFTEYSNIKKIKIQIDNDEQLHSFTQAAQSFKTHIIEGLKKNKLLQNYQFPLKEIDFYLCKYKISHEMLQNFLMEYLFTKEINIIKIRTFNLFGFGKDSQQEQQILKDSLNTIYQSLNYLQKPQKQDWFSLKNLCLSNSGCKIDLNIFRLFLLNDYIKLESILFRQEILAEDSKDYFNETLRFIQIQPQNFIHSLKCLSLIDVQTINFDLYKFLELFIYNPQIRLEKLVLLNLKSRINQESKNQLDQLIQQQKNIKFSLQTLKIGNLKPVESELAIVDYLLLTKLSQLQHLSIDQFHFDEYCDQLQILSGQKENDYFFLQLGILKIKNMNLKHVDSWNFLTKSIIFHKETKLTQLSFIGLKIDQIYFGAMSDAFDIFLYDNNYPMIQLKKLKFKNCEFKSNFLFFFIQSCKLKVLQIMNCGNIFYENNFNLIDDLLYQTQLSHRFKLEKIQVSDSKIIDINFFRWFLENIVLNNNRHNLQEISLSNMSFTDEHLEMLGCFLVSIPSSQNQLQRINLSGNNQISQQQWIDFFQNILQFFSKWFCDTMNDQTIFSRGEKDILVTPFKDTNRVINAIRENIQELQSKFDQVMNNKILRDFELFRPTYPTNIRNLTLYLSFYQWQQRFILVCYFHIIHGFILNPYCQLERLKLIFVNLQFFMNQIKLVEDFTSKQIEQLQTQKFTYHNQLKVFHINVQQSQQQNVKEFVMYFICTNNINLQKLYLSGFHNTGLISQILKQIQQRSNLYTIKKIQFHDVNETLTKQETLQFIEVFIFSGFLKLNSLTISSNIIFSELGTKEFKVYNQPITLEKFNAFILNNQFQKANYRNLLSILFCKKCKLRKIQLTYPGCLNEILDDVLIENQNLMLEKIVFVAKLILNDLSLRFILRSLNQLKYFQVEELIVEPFVLRNQIVQSEILQQKTEDRFINIRKKITVKNEQFNQLIMDQLILNPYLGFKQISIGDSSFQLHQISQSNIQFIKYLSFDFTSQQQKFNEQNLAILAEQIIYNEDSFCEKISFYKCQFTKEGIQAFDQFAEEFRIKIQRAQKVQKVDLRLCSFTMESCQLSMECVAVIIKSILYFEYISLEEISLKAMNLNDEHCQILLSEAINWIQFQKKHKRKHQKLYPLKILNLSMNPIIQGENVWQSLLSTFILSKQVPFLQKLDLSAMDLSDQTAEMMCKCAKKFFDQQKKSYVFPVTILNFSRNDCLSEQSWKILFENLFLHSKVRLDELYLNNTNIFLDKSIEDYRKLFEIKLELEKTQQLPLKIHLNQNNKFKNLVSEYIQYWPSNDKPFTQMAILPRQGLELKNQIAFEIENEIIQLHQEYIQQIDEQWNSDFRISAFQLNFVENYMGLLNYFYENESKTIEICLSLATLQFLSRFFAYTVKQAYIAPYPYSLLLNDELFKMCINNESRIEKITIIETRMEFQITKMEQSNILQMWKYISKSGNSIDQILVKYILNDELCFQMLKEGYDERDILSLVKAIPPFRIILKKGLSLPAIWGLYDIIKNAPYFQLEDINITFDQNSFINCGISYAIKEQIQSYPIKNMFLRFFQKVTCIFFDLFVSSDEIDQIILKQKFELKLQPMKQIRGFYLMALILIGFHNILFWLVCFLVPFIYFQSDSQEAFFDENQKCIYQINTKSNYLYLGFGIFSFFIELIMLGHYTSQVQGEKVHNISEFQEQLNEEFSQNKQNLTKLQGVSRTQNKQGNQRPKNKQDYKIDGENNSKEQIQTQNQQQFNLIPNQRINSEVQENQDEPSDPDQQQISYEENERLEQYASNMINFQPNSSSRRVNLEQFEKPFQKGIKLKPVSYFKRGLRWISDKLDYIFFAIIEYMGKKVIQAMILALLYLLLKFILSQAYKFNLFNDIQFILVAYACGETNIFIFALLASAITQLINIMQFIKVIFVKKSELKELQTTLISNVYLLAHLGRNKTLCSKINYDSFFNVSIFPNNRIFRYFFPNLAGRGISYPVSNYFFSFLFEEVPQVILQTYFVYKQNEYVRDQSFQMIWTYTVTIISLLLSFKTFMSISPLRIQNHYWQNLLGQKRENYEQELLILLQKEKEQLKFFMDFNPQNSMTQNIEIQE